MLRYGCGGWPLPGDMQRPESIYAGSQTDAEFSYFHQRVTKCETVSCGWVLRGSKFVRTQAVSGTTLTLVRLCLGSDKVGSTSSTECSNRVLARKRSINFGG